LKDILADGGCAVRRLRSTAGCRTRILATAGRGPRPMFHDERGDAARRDDLPELEGRQLRLGGGLGTMGCPWRGPSRAFQVAMRKRKSRARVSPRRRRWARPDEDAAPGRKNGLRRGGPLKREFVRPVPGHRAHEARHWKHPSVLVRRHQAAGVVRLETRGARWPDCIRSARSIK